jgi:uncharacterized repeat protein (TIGR03803 family)
MKLFSSRPCIALLAALAASWLAITPLRAGTLTTLYSFTGGSDGSNPSAGLVQDAAGVLYGATNHGGATQCTPHPGSSVNGCGTVFSFSQTTGFKTLVSFTGPNGEYGANTLLLSGTTLYGNTTNGGSNGDGVLFSVQTNGSGFTLLHQFSGTDGLKPDGTLQKGADGVLYGITASGGPHNEGVLFRLTSSGTYTILHAFTGGADGSDPNELLISKSGALVGSAYTGGKKSLNCPSGCGLLFAYVPATGEFAVLHTFNDVTDGATPYLGSLGTNDVAYGVAGSVFSFALPANYRNLASFNMDDGGDPYSGPALAANGSLIGTNTLGPNGSNSAGTLYQERNGVITNLYLFGGFDDGGAPAAQPLLTASGNIFGTTEDYGAGCEECGTILEYTP